MLLSEHHPLIGGYMCFIGWHHKAQILSLNDDTAFWLCLRMCRVTLCSIHNTILLFTAVNQVLQLWTAQGQNLMM